MGGWVRDQKKVCVSKIDLHFWDPLINFIFCLRRCALMGGSGGGAQPAIPPPPPPPPGQRQAVACPKSSSGGSEESRRPIVADAQPRVCVGNLGTGTGP